MEEQMERMAIAQVVQDWALARDTGRWDRLRATYAAGATMHTTWFVGSADEFLRRSMEAAKAGARVQHFFGASHVEVRGDRAVAESRCVLLVRASLQGVEVDVTCHCRFHDLFVREGSQWLIHRRIPIYEKDRLDPVDPSASVKLDPAQLARYPEGYRYLAYVQCAGGATITQGLPTPGSERLLQLYAEGEAWLAGTTIKEPF